jgi:hypothetical protein
MDTVMMESTFKIECAAAGGGLSIGTIFIVSIPVKADPTRGWPILVTANHVLSDCVGETATLYLRKQDDLAKNVWSRVPKRIAIRAKGQPLWVSNANADVAVMYLPEDIPQTFPVVATTFFATDELLTEYHIAPGDEVRALGYPLNLESNAAGFPVLRSGKIASFPITPTTEVGAFLVDFRVFKGNSGGPVYYVENLRPDLTKFGTYTNFHVLMGVVSEEVLETEASIGPYSQEIHQTQLGIAKVVPASFIISTIQMLPARPETPPSP